MIFQSARQFPVEMLQRLVGAGVEYTGDMANPSGRGAIVAAFQTQFGPYIDVTLEDGRRVRHFPLAGCCTKETQEGCRYRVVITGPVHGAPYLAQLEAAAILRTQNERAAADVARHNFETREAARVITDPPVFLWNGIKDARGAKLQPCWYSSGKLNSYPDGTITIYARGYSDFSSKVNECFKVENKTDTMTDYFDKDTIRVIPSHPLYPAIRAAMVAQDSHRDKVAEKRAARRT